MDIYVANLIIVIILAICYFYMPDFFTIETIILMVGIYVLVNLLVDDDSDKLIYGGNNSIKLVHTHDGAVFTEGGKEIPYMKMDLMDPKHNFREIAKQLILLEDHMAHKPKRCIDCITKHYLMTEGLLEEAITLDKTGEHIQEVNDITDQLKPVVMRIIDLVKKGKINDKEYEVACQTLRQIRKKIALKYVMNN